jgi:hypothetical protein
MGAMAYEMTGSTNVKDVKGARKYSLNETLKDVNMGQIVLYVLGRAVWPHKFAISFSINMWLLAVWMFPPLPEILKSLLASVF